VIHDRITTDYKKEKIKKRKITFKYVTSQLRKIKKMCKDKLMIIKFIDMYFNNSTL
jgi:hypothetical protein